MSNDMKSVALVALILTCAGCASKAAPPVRCDRHLVPINGGPRAPGRTEQIAEAPAFRVPPP